MSWLITKILKCRFLIPNFIQIGQNCGKYEDKYIVVRKTQCRRVFLEKKPGSQLVKKFLAFYGTRRFITPFTSTCCLSLSWASSIQSMPLHPNSWKSILTLSSHLRLGFPSGFFPHRKLVCTCPVSHECHMPFPADSWWFYHQNNVWWAVQIIKLHII